MLLGALVTLMIAGLSQLGPSIAVDQTTTPESWARLGMVPGLVLPRHRRGSRTPPAAGQPVRVTAGARQSEADEAGDVHASHRPGLGAVRRRHLSAVFTITSTPALLLMGKIMLLNALGGVVFGTLFWKYGLKHAMFAHFCADLVLHVGVPLFAPGRSGVAESTTERKTAVRVVGVHFSNVCLGCAVTFVSKDSSWAT